MNRVFGDKKQPDDTTRHESAFVIKASQPLGGQLFLGECPIIVDCPEAAREASQWGYERVKELLMEKGLDQQEAEAHAEDFRERQYKVMIAAVNKMHSDAYEEGGSEWESGGKWN